MSENTQKTTRQGLPSLPKSTIWMLSFGFLGVQTAFTLQSSQMSRIRLSVITPTAHGSRAWAVAVCRICFTAR